MNDSKETVAQFRDQAPPIEIDSLLKRMEELEGRCTQLETTMKDTVIFDTLAARLSSKKTIKKVRAKRELSPEEKAAFHARMVAARQPKEKARQVAANAESNSISLISL